MRVLVLSTVVIYVFWIVRKSEADLTRAAF